MGPPPVGRPGRLLPLRPLTVGDTLDGAFRSLRATFGKAALTVLLILGPYQLASSLLLALVAPEFTSGEILDPAMFDDPASVADLTGRLGIPGILLWVVGLLVNVIAGAAVVALVLRADRGEHLDVRDALRTAVARSGAAVGASVLTFVTLAVVAIAAIALLIPLTIAVPPLGILLFLVLGVVGVGVGAGIVSLVVPVAVVEDRGAWTTFTRVLWVARVRFWRLLGITLLILLLLGIASLVVSVPLTLLAWVVGSASWIVDGISATLVAVVTLPVGAFAALLVYLDARIRHEGYDLELRTEHLGPGQG